MPRDYIALSIILLMASYSSAAATAPFQDSFEEMWTADLGGEVNSLRISDINGDGMGEVIADSLFLTSYGRSGTLFSLDKSGTQSWKYFAGLLKDSYTTQRGYTILGAGPYAEFVAPDGVAIWKRSTRSSPLQSIDSQSVYASDLNNDGKDDAIIGTNLGSKGSYLSIRNDQGDELVEITFKGNEAPHAIYSADLNGDGIHEIMVGTIRYTPNTVSGSQQAAYSKPTTFRVFNIDGLLTWSDEYESAVTAVKSCVLKEDEGPVVIAGTANRFKVYDTKGQRLWEGNVNGQVTAIECGDIDGDGALDIAVGSNTLYAYKNTGEQLWSYNSGTVSAIRVADLGKDGKPEVIVASNSIRVFNDKGEVVYRSDNYGTITSLDVADTNDDNYENIVFGSKDHKVRALDTKAYSQEVMADHYYNQAEKAYTAQDYNLTVYSATEARDIYGAMEKESDKNKAVKLIEKATAYSDGNRYYNLSQYYFDKTEYGESVKYADKALEAYKPLNDVRKITEVDGLKKKAQMLPNAEVNLNLSRQYFLQGDYDKALEYSAKAKSGYDYLGNAALKEEASTINAKSTLYLEYHNQLDIAYNYSLANNKANATYHLKLAQDIYDRLNDTSLKPRYENVSSVLTNIKRKEDVIVYGGIGVVAFIILLIIAFIVLIALYFKQKGGFEAIRMLVNSYSNRSEGRGKGGDSGLRELRGRTGESIGDSFKR
ncbi:MAG: FG-GAP-like repeat-containing protein [Candidatus Altiarchaeota archaeon]